MNRKSFLGKPIQLASVMAIVILVLAACQSVATPTSVVNTAPAATSASEATSTPMIPVTGGSSAGADVTINVATDPTLGKILVDGNGMTLYVFTKDGPDQSNCTGGCLKVWPPLLTQGSPVAGTGVDASLLGTAKLADGTMIVTYNKMPLYRYASDAKAGDTLGQGVNNVWYTVSPDGNAVGMAPMIPAPTSTGTTAGAAAGATADVTINVATDPKLGQILVDGNGKTLYIFTKDGPDQSNCTGGCLKVWPPLLTQSMAKAGSGVDASLLGTAKLADGTMIVTYNKMPLYYYATDAKAGDTLGQGVNNVWYVVAPDGTPVKATASTGYGN